MKKYQGTVRWFDYLRGEGVLSISHGDTIFNHRFHFTSVYKPSNGNYSYPSQNMQNRLPQLLPWGQAVDIWIDRDGDVMKVIPIY